MKLKLIGDAGTGKTYTLLRYAQTFQDSIVLSHTTAAVREFLSRMKGNGVKVRTIHSIACSTLCKHDKLFRELFLRTEKAGGIEAVRHRFCRLKGIPYSPDPYTPDLGKKFFSAYSKAVNTCYPDFPEIPDKLARLIHEYEQFKLQRGYVDYEDMLKWIAEKSELLPECEALIVDEAQDLSPLQWRIVSSFDTNVFIAAGDELQAIFSFQGAEPSLFRNFPANTKILKKTFRIPEEIWKFAGKIIRNQLRRRRAKAVEDGGEVVLLKPMTLEEIARMVAAEKRTLVLLRHNCDVLLLSSILHDLNVEHDLAKEGPNGAKIVLDTIHSMKGREADRVILVDGIRNGIRNGTEEEARVWYVGATRARKRLVIAPLKDEGVRHFLTPIAENAGISMEAV